MQVPYSWIQELVDFDWSPEELADRLTLSGAEAEVSTLVTGSLDNIVVGLVTEAEPIENSDHLIRTIVDDGREKYPVVCGAPNVAAGQKVVLARVGAVLKGEFKIKKAKLRGVESAGMICAEDELGLSDDHSGIMVLDSEAPPGAPIGEYLGIDDKILKLDLTPNRPDLMSAIGVARDVACLSGKRIKRPSVNLLETSEAAAGYIKIGIDDPGACPRYAARIIRNVKIGPSPWWIRRKLMLSGIRPISNVVDITNLVMMETGHPLHAFDYDLFGSKEVLVRRARDGEKFTTLDGNEHELNPDVLLITNGRKPVACAGVMGGLDSEVTAKTATILLEAAYFEPRTTRRSRQKLGLVTESSIRFEKGADPNMVPIALDRAAALMAEYAGGEVLSGRVDCYPEKIVPALVRLRPERVNTLLGTDISRERMIEILTGLEFGVEDKGELMVTVPTFTGDITREVDLIEEIVRIEGYAVVPDTEENKGPLFTPQPSDNRFRDEIRRLMTGLGFDELYAPGLADEKLLEKVSGSTPRVRVLNPIADDLTVMENDLVYSLLRTVSHNLAHRNINLKIFGIGRIYLPGEPPVEKEQIGLAVTGREADRWYRKGRALDYYDIKGVIDTVLDSQRLSDASYTAAEHRCLQPERSFGVACSGETIGHAGLIRPELARAFDIKQTVYAAVLDFEVLMKLGAAEWFFRPLPRFPAAPRDLAVVVDEKVGTSEILSLIKKTAGPLLESVELFDLFRGSQVGEGRKSLAFAMVFRSEKRSLESDEVAEIHKSISSALKNNFNAEIREA